MAKRRKEVPLRSVDFIDYVFAAWAGSIFVLTFLLLYPFFIICIWVKPLKRFSYIINKIWCVLFFPFAFEPVFIEHRYKPIDREPVIYVSNHSSYFDIPVLTWALPGYICFIGKISLARIPLFGYVFRSFHITVNRRDGYDRQRSIQRAGLEIDQGRSIVFFAEGTINAENQPQLTSFKDGAFRIAIEKQIPVVPITIPYNWIIFPSDGILAARRHRCEVVIHPPISTIGMTISEDLDRLKRQVFGIIDEEINRKNTAQAIARYGGKPRVS
jgi:1-acyl-sn-glycerol-3-phosphate acyltransferase